MKTSLPLSRKQEEYVLRSKTAGLGWPFEDAAYYGVYFKQADIDYVEKNITNHAAYRFIKQSMKNKDKRGSDMCIQFFNLFQNDPKCPEEVRAFLASYVGWLCFCMNKYPNGTNNLEQFFMDRWIETCR